jgi:hypothetical protein
MGKLKHGHGYGTPTYNSWRSMVRRCSDSNHHKFPAYGAVGVRVSNRWLGQDGFTNFLADMGERPTDKTIDRYPNPSGDYSPTNCRWASVEEQNNNKRTNQLVTLQGITLSIARHAARLGTMSRGVLRHRLNAGWSEQEILTIPVGGNK